MKRDTMGISLILMSAFIWCITLMSMVYYAGRPVGVDVLLCVKVA